VDLASLEHLLGLQLSRSEAQFRATLSITAKAQAHQRRHQLEGVLSDAWQAYCAFVRQLCIRSATGCKTKGGAIHNASVVPATWQRVSYLAMSAARRKPVQPAALNSLLWKEPTWGDTAKVVDIINTLNPANAATLRAFLGGGLLGPKHCQIVRNACAHKNLETKGAVLKLSTSYLASPITYPTDALTWRDPASMEFAFVGWLDDMRTIAAGAVS
jgi:hypothetical protein